MGNVGFCLDSGDVFEGGAYINAAAHTSNVTEGALWESLSA